MPYDITDTFSFVNGSWSPPNSTKVYDNIETTVVHQTEQLVKPAYFANKTPIELNKAFRDEYVGYQPLYLDPMSEFNQLSNYRVRGSSGPPFTLPDIDSAFKIGTLPTFVPSTRSAINSMYAPLLLSQDDFNSVLQYAGWDSGGNWVPQTGYTYVLFFNDVGLRLDVVVDWMQSYLSWWNNFSGETTSIYPHQSAMTDFGMAQIFPPYYDINSRGIPFFGVSTVWTLTYNVTSTDSMPTYAQTGTDTFKEILPYSAGEFNTQASFNIPDVSTPFTNNSEYLVLAASGLKTQIDFGYNIVIRFLISRIAGLTGIFTNAPPKWWLNL
jgi:hypothetical protein